MPRLLFDRHANGSLIVTLDKRLDSANAAAVQRRLVGRAAREPVVLDCTDLTYLSSAGLRALLAIGRRAEQAGRRVVLCHIDPQVRALLAASGFLEIFDEAETMDKAAERAGSQIPSPHKAADFPRAATVLDGKNR